MKKSEQFSEESRRQIVAEVLAGKMTKEKARQVYGFRSKSAILEWNRIFAEILRSIKCIY